MSGQHELTKDVDVDLAGIFSSIWRHKGKLLLAATLATVLAYFVLQTIDPKYKASARILIKQNEQVLGAPTGQTPQQTTDRFDESGMASQVELLRSPELIRGVAEKLSMQQREVLAGDGGVSAPKRILQMLGLVSDTSNVTQEDRLYEAFDDNLVVYQAERARVVVVEFTSTDRKLAAEIPNLISREYLVLQEKLARGVGQDELELLKPEVDALRTAVREADGKVADFRENFDILDGAGTGTLATQELSELATELGRVRAQRSQAEADANAVSRAVQSGQLDNASSVLNSPLIQRLREQQVSLNGQLAERSTTLLARHPVIQRLQSQISNLNSQIGREARKIQRSLQENVRTARSREQALVQQRNTLKSESGRVGRRQVELAELQRDADAKRQQLNAYLLSYQEAQARTAREYVPVDAFIFASANPPSQSFFPKVLPILAGTFFGVLLLGAMVTLAGAILTAPAAGQTAAPARVEPDTAAHLQSYASAKPAPYEPQTQERRVFTPAIEAAKRAASVISPLRSVDAPSMSPEEPVAGNALYPGMTANDAASASFQPRSNAVAAATEHLLQIGAKRVVVVPDEPGNDGRATMTLARQLAERGARVVLVDMTEEGHASQSMLGSRDTAGIGELITEGCDLGEALHRDTGSRVHVIPIGRVAASASPQTASKLAAVLGALRHSYDYVVVDRGMTELVGLDRVFDNDTVVVISSQRDIETAKRLHDILLRGGYGDAMIMSGNAVGQMDADRPLQRA
ncbi:GumC family protein [Ahrensia sp. R2A130]|uniref:GumC family protein n=1 Tax=Ahrensia sp. R2A130 TaxID=744979 RepID=UPI0018DE8A93|nr:Wzz/FepE/Etk N-terminal domain-containing protein [Ahrensia sp. R2A130]